MGAPWLDARTSIAVVAGHAMKVGPSRSCPRWQRDVGGPQTVCEVPRTRECAQRDKDAAAGDGAADALAGAGDERHATREPARAHRAPSLPSHSSIPSIMTPFAAFG
jgi:hypothetical protein